MEFVSMWPPSHGDQQPLADLVEEGKESWDDLLAFKVSVFSIPVIFCRLLHEL